ncbi:uncharacterized protein LOC133910830 [Phragmites australis]|uniref:uncharacterized protein LOC133910830 n=1 Tax=Phragmites australis TaxID=29695 RepID=UPI002D7911D2|nr:uncharacterized protein LOC133910830 [Phragmites australis]
MHARIRRRKSLPTTPTTNTKNHSLNNTATYIYMRVRWNAAAQFMLEQKRRKKLRRTESKKMAAPMGTSLFVLFLCVSLHVLPAADAARLPPGSSQIMATCKTGPFPELCVRELVQRLLDIQIALASASDQAATIAGGPGQVDAKALVAVAMEAAAEAGAVATSVFEGKLPGFNSSVPDFRKCLANCTVTMKSAMKKIHGASAAVKAGANDIAKTLASRAIGDVSSCTLSCKELNGDVRLILQQSLVEFQKMLQIAVAFISKIKPKPVPPPPVPTMP